MQTSDGSTYKGLFYCMKSTESGDRHIVLTHATKDDQKDIQQKVIIPHSVFASLSAEEIDLAGQDIAAKPFHAPSRFEDSNIGNDGGYDSASKLTLYVICHMGTVQCIGETL
jgi:hypothetical protein